MISLLINAAVTAAAVLLLPVAFVLGVLLTQLFLSHLHIIYLNLRYGLNKIPEPKLPFIRRFTVGHNHLQLLLKLPRDEAGRIFRQWRREHGDIFLLRGLMGEPVVYVMSGSGIMHVASKGNADKYCKPQVMVNNIESIVGKESMLLVGNPQHQRLRRIVAPAFHNSSLMSLTKVFMRHANKLTDEVLENSNKGNNFQPDLMKLIRERTFAMIVDACFGDRVVSPQVMDDLNEKYFSLMNQTPQMEVRRWALQRFFNFVPKDWFGYREDVKRNIKDRLRRMVTAAHALLATSTGGAPKAVPSLVSVMREKEKDLSDVEAESLVMTFLSAGQITTAYGLAWLMYNLASHPGWQEKARAELKEWDAEAEDALQTLDELPLLDRIIKETLRKDPPISIATRDTRVPQVIDGVHIPPGVTVRFPVYALQRDPEIWGPDANTFNPARWESDDKLHTSPFYALFWHGTRGCIGKRFAVLEMKAFIAGLLKRVRLSVRDEDPEPYVRGVFGNPIDLAVVCQPLEG